MVCWCAKMDYQLVHSPTRIDSFILPQSTNIFNVFWGSALQPLFIFGRVPKSAIVDWSISCCQSTLIKISHRIPAAVHRSDVFHRWSPVALVEPACSWLWTFDSRVCSHIRADRLTAAVSMSCFCHQPSEPPQLFSTQKSLARTRLPKWPQLLLLYEYCRHRFLSAPTI